MLNLLSRPLAAVALLLLPLAGGVPAAARPAASGRADALARGFREPPASARPWVYWFWLNGNITREGITADLEAMRRAGIGGVLIMEVDQGAPLGPVAFASPAWRDLFQHVCAEANRLGIEVNMNDDAGWNGSGGPWITPDLAMQKLVWSEAEVSGPGRVAATLPRPPTVAGHYRDVALLAFPTPSDYRIPDLAGKSALTRQDQPPRAVYPSAPEGAAVARGEIVDLTGRMAPDGRVEWEAPAGRWTLLRLGHTCTGAVNAPAPESGRGLECDKLSKEGAEAAFAGLMGKLIADVGPLAGRTLVRTHIDSWENGSQNWTPRFREEFLRLRGYDPLPYLPAMTGRVVESAEVSERFLWDVRQTVADLIHDNYAGHIRDLAHQHGLGLSIEAYGDTTCDDMTYAGRADEPMAEFWSWSEYGAAGTLVEMTSAAHVYGKPIVGAEAFTASDGERWQAHPGGIKALGDWAFAQGINRFVVHRYALQPWRDRRPGMSMGPWGLHYERTQTWWDQSTAWHRYVSRCQYMLRQGLFVADVLYLQPEGAPRAFAPPPPVSGAASPRPGYNYDGCTPEALLTRVAVKGGRLVLPDGVSYRALVLPAVEVMTPTLLRRVKQLADAGATVIGPKPSRSPSLAGFPACDAEVKRLADALWGSGRVITGRTVDRVLASRGIPPDFRADRVLNWIHRRAGADDIYFVANGRRQAVNAYCRFRVTGKRPELWRADTGSMEPAPVYRESGGVTEIPIRLDPGGSVFVVFRPGAPLPGALARFGAAGRLSGSTPTRANEIVVRKAIWGAAARSADVTDVVRQRVAEGARSFPVAQLGPDPAPNVPKQLRVAYEVAGKARTAAADDFQVIHIGTPEDLGKPITVVRAVWGPPGEVDRVKDVTAQVQRLARERNGAFLVADLAAAGDPAVNVVKTLHVEYSIGGRAHTTSATDPEVITFALPADEDPGARAVASAGGGVAVETARPGRYEAVTRAGRRLAARLAAAPPTIAIGGPWDVAFDPRWGGPARARLERLASWSLSSDPGIRYYSGAAIYRTTFRVPAAARRPGRRAYLDLGDVQVMASVRLNGQDLGILWKAPYRVDVTSVLRAGVNALEVRATNLWINRMIGDEELPEDSPRQGGTMARWPDWLLQDRPSPTGRYTFTSWRLWPRGAPLRPSGLLGPVRVETADVVRLVPAR
ncbi:MAG: hypothetical protein IT208_08220 [Chthonomonadales bacterium]|nr:hypothetical protein [Chthonomonadales bacterium]